MKTKRVFKKDKTYFDLTEDELISLEKQMEMDTMIRLVDKSGKIIFYGNRNLITEVQDIRDYAVRESEERQQAYQSRYESEWRTFQDQKKQWFLEKMKDTEEKKIFDSLYEDRRERLQKARDNDLVSDKVVKRIAVADYFRYRGYPAFTYNPIAYARPE